jgi:hypothetical protein
MSSPAYSTQKIMNIWLMAEDRTQLICTFEPQWDNMPQQEKLEGVAAIRTLLNKMEHDICNPKPQKTPDVKVPSAKKSLKEFEKEMVEISKLKPL